MGTAGVPRLGGQAEEVEAAGQATPILPRQVPGAAQGQTTTTERVSLTVPTQGAVQVPEGGQATRGAYAADAAPTSRVALPSSVR